MHTSYGCENPSNLGRSHVCNNIRMRLTLFAILPLAASLAAQTPQTANGIPSSQPLSYNCYRTQHPIKVDGNLNDPAWQQAPWTTDFVDIEGAAKPSPRYRTRAKILWDENYLYIAAELEEPNLQAALTEHDSVIFKDNDFEVFLKPAVLVPSDPANPSSEKQQSPGYYEFEINARNTSWDLYLNKPYLDNGKPDNTWNIPGLKTAVKLHGTLNQSTDKDRGWTVEIAFPWSAYTSANKTGESPRPSATPPTPGAQWRINFSRVEWVEGHQQPGEHEANWVWSPQGVINMHVPEKWGYLNFKDKK